MSINEKTDINQFWMHISSLDRSLSELSIHLKHDNKKVDFLENKIQNIVTENKLLDKKVEEYINKGKGAWTIMIMLASFAQIILISLIGFVFKSSNENENALIVVQQQIKELQDNKIIVNKKIESFQEFKGKK